jgi:hypothetical protein
VHEFFFKIFFAVLFILFLNNPLLEFYFFSKNFWRGGGEEVKIFFPESKNFSGQIKKVEKNFFGLTSV